MTTEAIKVGNGGAGIVGFVQYMYGKFNEVKGTNYNLLGLPLTRKKPSKDYPMAP
ncbi:MAG: hypothetical protein ACFB10_26400 [Salibacteraceae bacterium]